MTTGTETILENSLPMRSKEIRLFVRRVGKVVAELKASMERSVPPADSQIIMETVADAIHAASIRAINPAFVVRRERDVAASSATEGEIAEVLNTLLP